MTEKTLIRRVGLVVRRFLRRLRRYYPESITEDFMGACAIASTTLTRILKRCGLPATFVLGRFYTPAGQHSSHAWVEVDGVIVDVTATQFGKLPAVLFTKACDPRYDPYWRGRGALRIANGWGKDQAPARHEGDINETVRALCG